MAQKFKMNFFDGEEIDNTPIEDRPAVSVADKSEPVSSGSEPSPGEKPEPAVKVKPVEKKAKKTGGRIKESKVDLDKEEKSETKDAKKGSGRTLRVILGVMILILAVVGLITLAFPASKLGLLTALQGIFSF